MEIFFIIKKFGGLVLNHFKLFRFQYLWRRLNKNNKTTAVNIFPAHVVSVGEFSYGELLVYTWGTTSESLAIGSFCSIASDVKFILGGNHQINNISTYPFKYYFNNAEIEAYSKGKITIGDDVWIGRDVTILSAVTIGQGSVIAAGSIITKSFPSYSIIGGIPAKIIGKRFSDEVIEILVNVDFSKLSQPKIKKELNELYKNLKVMSKDQIIEYLISLDLLNKSYNNI